MFPVVKKLIWQLQGKKLNKFIRFAGEKCVANDDCYNQNCTKSVCTGIAKGQNCTDDQSCMKGNFCQSQATVPTCVAQLAKGTNCTRSLECVNSNFCWNGKCTE